MEAEVPHRTIRFPQTNALIFVTRFEFPMLFACLPVFFLSVSCSVSLSVCLCVSVCQYVCLFRCVDLLSYLSLSANLCLPIHMSASVCLLVGLSVCKCICKSSYLSCPSPCLHGFLVFYRDSSICLSACSFVFYVCSSVCLITCVYLFITCLPVSACSYV